MVEEEGIVLIGFCAEEIELGGHFPGIEGEVFADEVGEAFYNVVIAEQLFLDGMEFCVDVRVVEQAWIVGAEVEVNFGAVLFFEGFCQGQHFCGYFFIHGFLYGA